MNSLEIDQKKHILTPELKKQIATFGIEIVQLVQTLEYIRREASIKGATNPNTAWQLKQSFINAIAHKHPNNIHYKIAQEAWRSANLSNSTEKSEDIVHKLAMSLSSNLCILNKSMSTALSQDFKNVSKEIIQLADKTTKTSKAALNIIFWPKTFDSYFEKGNLFLFDYVFLEHLKKIGKEAASIAKELKPMLEKRYKSFKKTGKSYFGFWFNIKPTTEKPFFQSDLLLLLAIALLKDQVINSNKNIDTMRVSAIMANQELPQNKTYITSPQTQKVIKTGEWKKTDDGFTSLTLKDHKVVTTLQILLHQKSPKVAANSEDFYRGNEPYEIIKSSDLEFVSPVISVSPHEFYKTYTGKDDYSGKDIKTADNALKQTASRIFTAKFECKKTQELNDKNQDRFRIAELNRPLFIRDNDFDNLTNEQRNLVIKGDKAVRKKMGRWRFKLHPLFREDIDNIYLQYPTDLPNRIKKAEHSIGCKATASTYMLLKYLAREHSHGRYNPEISRKKLYRVMGLEKMAKKGKKKRLSERRDKDFQIIKKVGLLNSHEEVASKNSNTEMKDIFHLNSNWPKNNNVAGKKKRTKKTV